MDAAALDTSALDALPDLDANRTLAALVSPQKYRDAYLAGRAQQACLFGEGSLILEQQVRSAMQSLSPSAYEPRRKRPSTWDHMLTPTRSPGGRSRSRVDDSNSSSISPSRLFADAPANAMAHVESSQRQIREVRTWLSGEAGAAGRREDSRVSGGGGASLFMGSSFRSERPSVASSPRLSTREPGESQRREAAETQARERSRRSQLERSERVLLQREAQSREALTSPRLTVDAGLSRREALTAPRLTVDAGLSPLPRRQLSPIKRRDADTSDLVSPDSPTTAMLRSYII